MTDTKITAVLRACASNLALTALILTVLSSLARPSLAMDWGYDDAPVAPSSGDVANESRGQADNNAPTGHQPKGTSTWKKGAAGRGQRPARSISRNARGKNAPNTTETTGQQGDETSLRQEPSLPVAPKGPTAEEIAARKKVDDLKCWMQIYALAASSPSEDDRNQILNLGTLPADTRKKLEKMTFQKLEQAVPEYLGVSAMWLPLSQKVTEDLDYKESYRLLFRALLRHAVSRIEATAPEAEVIQEVLGPARIAEMGPPILTEDAINAYSDMTCFLYQRTHPDHTVEGDENRQLFAEVIRQRYNDAPNLEAKKAMCNFDVTWASFRCRYLDSSAADKDKLISSISDGKGGGGGANASSNGTGPKTTGRGGSKNKSTAVSLTSPKLLKIFALGPWAENSKTIPVAVKMSQMSESTK